MMLQSSTVSFLTQIKKNNNKAWFDAHKEKYMAAKTNFEELAEKIITEYGKVDSSIGKLAVKDCVFRIYRDVRFSKNKTPYKNHFAASFNKGGKKVHYPGFYFHAEPGGLTFCGGGIWRPDANELKKVRQEIDYNFDEFQSIIQAKPFKKLFGELDQEDVLMRVPKDYEENNPAAAYLKLKSFLAGVSLADSELTSPSLSKKIVNVFTTMKPFVDFLSRALD